MSNRILIESTAEPTFIKSLDYGFNMIKRQGKEPMFEVWLGTCSARDFIGSLNFSDAVKFLLKGGYCSDYKEAIQLLNKGGYHV